MTERLSIAMQLQEVEAWIRELSTQSARPGKGQELARMRLASAQAVQASLCWCRDNAEDLRAFRAAKGETEWDHKPNTKLAKPPGRKCAKLVQFSMSRTPTFS